MNDDFSKILHAHDIQGWLRAYVEHTRDMEAPTAFHFFTGLTILGAVLKRRVYVNQVKFKLHPCFHVLLCGPAGKVKKSTAAEYGRDIGKDSGEVTTLMSAGSPEKLWDKLYRIGMEKGQTTGLLFVDEMATLIGNRDYSSSMVEILMVIFDSKADVDPRETFAHKSQALKNVAVSALFCSNEEMLISAMPKHAMKGGLPSRMIVVHEEVSGRKPIPLLDEEPEPIIPRDPLVTDLTKFRFTSGKATITQDARKWFRPWYSAVLQTYDAITDDNIRPFYSRYGDHLLKVGLALSIQEMKDPQAPVVIDARHLIQAGAVLEYTVERLPKFYRRLGMGPYGVNYTAIRTLLRGGEREMSWLGAQMSNHMGRRQLLELISDMSLNGEVEQVRREGRHYMRLVQK